MLSGFKFNARTDNPQPRTSNFEPRTQTFDNKPFGIQIIPVIFALLLKNRTMAVTRLKRKGRKDKAVAAVRRQSLKIQNFQPVIKNVDIEKIKEEFKSKAKKA